MTYNNTLDLLIFFFITLGFMGLMVTTYEMFKIINGSLWLAKTKFSIRNKMLWWYIIPWLIASILIIINYLTK